MVHSRRVFSFVVAAKTKGRMTLLLVHLCLALVVRWAIAACAADTTANARLGLGGPTGLERTRRMRLGTL